MITFSCDLTLAQFVAIITRMYAGEPDDFVVSIGDWRLPIRSGEPAAFADMLKLTVGDFRRWHDEPAAMQP